MLTMYNLSFSFSYSFENSSILWESAKWFVFGIVLLYLDYRFETVPAMKYIARYFKLGIYTEYFYLVITPLVVNVSYRFFWYD
jgi:hypothetical protein